MDLYSRDAEDFSDTKRESLRGHLNEDDEPDENDTSGIEELSEALKGHKINPGQKAVASSEDNDEELGSALRVGEESRFPIPANLVSALKGSREKQGIPPKKLTVTWAPDVYDPVPSIPPPSRGKKQQKSKRNNDNKKNGKKGQKGSNSRGSGKDKKHSRKSSSSSEPCYLSRYATNTLATPSNGPESFVVGNPDPYCGSSFLKNAPTKMHFSVAEAL